ncbi:cyclin-like protein [Protomyces lactucae-debilis]|uniref:Cyclin-like protein n=1 Tax=Protomyces lactucae-debilis TaxID=2754530 RepID=A0A1Y2F1F5_PROLT|nr:cyclin-like protein [Protomyces lactucae-debilis]ORY77699.1 cyclin-like protein [Protomyces lactucae-debilis]
MPHAVASVYQESSQFQRWHFEPEELTQKRQAVNLAAIDTCTTNLALETELSGKQPAKPADFPNWEEELLHVNFYARKLSDTADVFDLPPHLRATAAQYLKRFYLMRSVLQYHPKSIMITCLFLATKTCEHYVPLDTFATKLKTSKEAIIQHEFEISSTILFDYVHWSAYRPLHGFVLDMERFCAEEPKIFELKAISQAHSAAKALISSCLWSDLPFLHAPSHLALAALLAVAEELVTGYLAAKGLESLQDNLHDIRRALLETSATAADLAAVKAVDKKIYYSSDPGMKADSALTTKRQAEEASAGQAKRRSKDEAAKQAQDDFGEAFA